MTTSPSVLTRAAAAAVDLVKVYGSGDTAVYALGGVTAEFAAARFTAIMGLPFSTQG
jgi:putative ABC transport system ATP-binding protein